ncbi:hypothetical protein VRB30_13375 [Pseudomonas poae]|uniref:hypothetical protein n=1 Tax=Pseudomonas poae TaxID=200451 RepID=UPI0030E35C2C
MKLPQPQTADAPFESVCNFYGISPHYSSPAFAQQTQMMGQTQRFPNPVEDPDRIVNDLIRKKQPWGTAMIDTPSWVSLSASMRATTRH